MKITLSILGKDWKIQSSPIILDVAEKDLYITMAVSSNQILPNDEEQKRVKNYMDESTASKVENVLGELNFV